MTRHFTQVAPSLWHSPRFLALPDDVRLLFVYFLTGPHQNNAGCFRLPDGYACSDLRWEAEKYVRARTALVQAGLIQFDPVTSEILIERWFKHCAPANEPHRKGVEGTLGRVQSDNLREAAENALEEMMATSFERKSAGTGMRAGRGIASRGP